MGIEQIIRTLGLSIVPISEIRGAMINCVIVEKLGGFDLFWMYLVSVAGNFLPVPFIILLFRPLLKFFKRFRPFRGLCEWLEKRTHKKASKMSDLGMLALYFFVAVPLPTTGAWTGSMIAGLFDMRLRRALPAILLGIMTSGIIMILLCRIGASGLGFLSFLIK